jgi:uncharacterized membrane protein
MRDDTLRHFLNEIDPFTDLWPSVDLVAYAVRHSDQWRLLGARASFSPSEFGDSSETLLRLAEFVVLRSTFPSSGASKVLADIYAQEKLVFASSGRPERVEVFFDGGSVPSTNLSGNSSVRISKDGGAWKILGVKGTGFYLRLQHNYSLHNIFAGRFFHRLDSELALKGFEGLDGLCSKYTPGFQMSQNCCPSLDIVAAFPISVEVPDGRGPQLIAAQRAFAEGVDLRAFFKPTGGTASQRAVQPDGVEHGNGTFTWELSWPQGSDFAEVRAFYKGEEVDRVEVSRWSGSVCIRGAVDGFFDEDHARLREGLVWKEGPKRDEFENAVVRLLNLLGIQTIWYGRVGQSRSDAVGFYLEEPRILFLVECTRDKPNEKFSALRERSRLLGSAVASDALVVPVVATAASAVESEFAAARDYGVALLGQQELASLFGWLQAAGKSTVDVARFIVQCSGSHVMDLDPFRNL